MDRRAGRFRRIVTLAGVALVVLAVVPVNATVGGVVRGGDAVEAEPIYRGATVQTTERPRNVSETLVRLTRADDPASFAAAHGIDYEDGRAVVVVELGGASTIPDGYGVTVQQTATVGGETFVQAWVPVDRIVSLSEEPAVTYVRLPERAVTAEPRTDVSAQTDRSSEEGGASTGVETRSPVGVGAPLLFVGAAGLAAVLAGLYGRRRR